MIEQKRFPILVNPNTRFIFSTSGSASSIERHNRAMERLGLNLVYTTFSFDISPEECAGLLRSPLAGGGVITGKNGLKTRIIPQLD